MRALKIGYTGDLVNRFLTTRETALLSDTDLTDICAAVVSLDRAEALGRIADTCFGIPVFVYADDPAAVPAEVRAAARRIVNTLHDTREDVGREIEEAAAEYEARMLPPFFDSLTAYIELNNLQFDCPGHQGGRYLKKHPAGRFFYDYYGEMIFKSDICNADVAMGDLLIHEGPPSLATKNAARVFHADETFFVLNGTSTSNHIAIAALVTPGDLVLFDRNNHKSVYDAALTKCGGAPVYLETARNPLGFIGGIDEHCFEESYLRARAAAENPEKAKNRRPFRLAVIQLGTYDGTVCNARQVVDRIGALCDYILFDSAWVGYEQFIPMMKSCSPLLLQMGEGDPGILVTQSVHKQQAGFSQGSYLHKKDSHIKGQKRYVDHKRLNSAYRMNASTSPFYPLYASLDVNARMQDGAAGEKLWDDCVRLGIKARKRILRECELLRPFVPPAVRGIPWQDHKTDEIARDLDFFRFEPGESWHSFEGYGKDQYFLDPNKLMLTTPGIDLRTGGYEDFGIPAAILASYLRDCRVVPEKNDFNSILFLMTPAETEEKMDALISLLVRFEAQIKEDVPLKDTLPVLYAANADRYRDCSIRGLCGEMHGFYRENDAKTYQKRLFREAYFPERVLSASAANVEFVRGNAKLVRVRDIEGEVALEGALPYPPGIFCVAPGERWSRDARNYLMILEEGINRFPGFSPEIHGVHFEYENGRAAAYGYVLDR
ncbi:MAG: ornithine decarboxylase [Clostridiales Family XIII bacterium]|jgi:ornithine decarboxylase|nr:ornithine decarboxylase [Clostridiales Family XIII bacterium]